MERLGQVMKSWCPSGHRPLVPKQGIREYVYAYAAIAPEIGKMTTLVLPYVNIKMMELFLKEVSQDFADYFILMQVDQVMDTLCEGLNYFNSVPEKLKSMTYFPHLRITF